MKKFFLNLLCFVSAICVCIIGAGVLGMVIFVFSSSESDPGWFANSLITFPNAAIIYGFSPFVFFMKKTRVNLAFFIVDSMEKIRILPR